MDLLIVTLRFSAIALAIATIYLMLRDGRQYLVSRIGALLLFAIVAMLFIDLPGTLRLSREFEIALYYLKIPILPLVWWFGLALLQEGFRLRPVHWGGLLLFTGLTAWNITVVVGGGENLLNFPILLLSYVLLVHLAVVTLLDMKDDLIDQRRRARIALVIFLVFGEIVTLVPSVFQSGLSSKDIALINLVITFVVVIWAFQRSSRFHSEVLTFAPVAKPEPVPSKIDPRDAPMHQRLNEVMESEKLYTEHGLTIRALADHIKVPEHQLRVLINRGLGCRNFSEFLNGYRVRYAKSLLSDPEQARKSVLTIAMDAGFASVSSFNRVFKELEAVTPSEFRNRALASTAQN